MLYNIGISLPVNIETVYEDIKIDSLYDAYIQRQQTDIANVLRDERLLIPSDIDYSTLPSLSKEMQERLNKHKPETLSQATKIPGLTPAAITTLLAFIKKKEKAPNVSSANS